MSTKIYLGILADISAGSVLPEQKFGTGKLDPDLTGTPQEWNQKQLMIGSTGTTAITYTWNTVAGNTTGIEFILNRWISPPLSADVTISGSITANLWGSENSMSANAGMQVGVYKVDPFGAFTQIALSAKGTEFGTSLAVQNWSFTPTSTALKKGDRLLVIPSFKNVGTMGGGFTCTLSTGWDSVGSIGESYLTFTETISFNSTTPSGSSLWLTDVASDVSQGVTAKEAWTTAGSGSKIESQTSTTTGPVSPYLITATTGGSSIEWYSRRVKAFTLSGMIAVSQECKADVTNSGAGIRVEVAICDADGSNPVLWGSNQDGDLNIVTTENTMEWRVSGYDASVSDGQRLRLRLYLDDGGFVGGTLVAGHTISLYYDGGSSATTRLTLTQSVTEFVSFLPYISPYVQIIR